MHSVEKAILHTTHQLFQLTNHSSQIEPEASLQVVLRLVWAATSTIGQIDPRDIQPNG